MNVLRIQKVHRTRWRATDGSAGRGLCRQRVGAKALEATVEDDVGVQVLEALEARFRHVGGGILGLDALDGLQRVQVVLVHHVVGDDQVGVVATTHQRDPEGVHLLHDRCRTEGGTAVRGSRPSLVLPEGPL